MNCPSCGASVSPRAEFCPQCLGQLAPRPAGPEGAAALAAPEPAAVEAMNPSTAVVACVPLAVEDTSICQQHPLLPASTCRQCGARYCTRCLSGAFKQVLCTGCNTSLALREAPEVLRRLFRELWITPSLVGTVIAMISIKMTGMSDQGMLIPGILGICLSLPFLLLAHIIRRHRSLTAAWFTFGLEVLLPLLIFLVGLFEAGFNLFLLVFVAVAAIIPIMTVAQIFKIKDLQALQRAHSGGFAHESIAPRG